MDFKELIEKGKQLKEDSRLSEAAEIYSKAYELAENDHQKSECLQYLLHVHTDRCISVFLDIRNIPGYYNFQWPWYPGNIPSSYKKPPLDEVFN